MALVSIGTANGSGTNPTITLSGTVPAGALIIVGVMTSDASGPGLPTDTASNVYVNLCSGLPNGSSTNGTFRSDYKYNCAQLVNGNTISYSLATSNWSMTAFYWDGAMRSSDPYRSAFAGGFSGSSTTPNCGMGNGAPVAGSLAVAWCAFSAGSGVTYTQDTGDGFATPPVRATSSANSLTGGTAIVNANTPFTAGLSATTPWVAHIDIFAAARNCHANNMMLGFGCAVALARKIEENPIITRRTLILPVQR